MWRQVLVIWTIATGLAGMMPLGAGCFGSGSGSGSGGGDNSPGSADSNRRASDARRQHPLDTLPTATVTINGHALRLWLAREFDEAHAGAVQEGLMHVPPEEIADDQGMLFVFSDERQRGFWMRNTITPLDIAYARMNGTIVKIWQMPALTWNTFPSIEPAMFALEVKQGTFQRLGIHEGDRIIIPDEVFKTSP